MRIQNKQVLEQIAVMQAYVTGADIEQRYGAGYAWYTKDDRQFDFATYEYRIKSQTIRYRRYVAAPRAEPAVFTTNNQTAAEHIEKSRFFVRWIDIDWQEVPLA